MRARTVFLWITPALLIAFLIGLLTARAIEREANETFWNEPIVERVRALVGEYYVDPIPEDVQRRLFFEAMEAYLSGLDDYCTFYDPEERQKMEVDTSGQFGGIGVLVQVEADQGGLRITGLRAGDPAARAGVLLGDRIIAVDRTPVAGLDRERITAMIKGAPGTTVVLGLVREDRTLEIEMARSGIKVDSVKGVRIADEQHGIGYFHVVSFQENTGRDAEAALAWLREKGARSLVLDLRQNRGGVLEKGAVSLVDLFLDEGAIVKTTGRSPGSRRIYEATREATRWRDEPVVVLVDGGSASAAEVVAGAFQDHRRAILVGERTYGKFLVQSIHRLPELDTALALTTARYYTPYGRWLQRRDREGIRGGLLPDVVSTRPAGGEEALLLRFGKEHGLDMQVDPSEEPEPVDDPQLRRAVEILGDWDAYCREGPR